MATAQDMNIIVQKVQTLKKYFDSDMRDIQERQASIIERYHAEKSKNQIAKIQQNITQIS